MGLIDPRLANLRKRVKKLEEGSGEQEDVTVSSSDITDATSLGRSVLTASDQAAARTAIGAGTSNLVIGTTASTAAAGNHTHLDLENRLNTLESAVADLANRVAALEEPVE